MQSRQWLILATKLNHHQYTILTVNPYTQLEAHQRPPFLVNLKPITGTCKLVDVQHIDIANNY